MFVLTAKLSKTKLIAAGVLVVAVILLVVLLLGGGKSVTADLSGKPVGATNQDRVTFLASFGWDVNAEPKEAQTVKIPKSEDNRVFARYNDLQLSQGYDLSSFGGKEVQRYVYEVLNYPDSTSPVYASILVYDGHIIGGDITDTAPDGLIHSFQKPGTTVPSSQPETPSTEAPQETTQATEASSSATQG